jgi:RNA polymerase sigma-70 factor (ECF subfamily)
MAAALFTTPAALAQRLARARASLSRQDLALPAGPELARRRSDVLTVLPLLFRIGQQALQRTAMAGVTDANEANYARDANGTPDATGTTTTAGTSAATREALRSACWEAMRLARALAAHPATASPEADAVAALLLLHGARLTGRVDAAGDIVPLAGQARDRWDAGLVRMGLQHLQAAQRGGLLTRWHMLAGIAAEHAVAPRWEDTDWAAICRWYGWLVKADGSPAPRLGHAIALVESGEPERGQQVLQALLPTVPAALRAHTLAALARAHERLGQRAQARDALAQAVAAAPSAADARLLQRRLDGLRAAKG